jgi:hypothetical protein
MVNFTLCYSACIFVFCITYFILFAISSFPGLAPPTQSVFLNGYVKELVFVNITHSDILDAFEKLFVTVLQSKNNHSGILC